MLENRREELITKKDKLVESLALNPELATDTKRVIEKVEAEITTVDDDIKDSNELKKEFLRVAKFGLDLVKNYDKYYLSISHENRLKCKQMLFPQDFYVKKSGKVYTQEISPLYRFASNKKDLENDSKSLLVERVRKNFHLISDEVKRWQNLIMAEYNRYKSTGEIDLISTPFGDLH